MDIRVIRGFHIPPYAYHILDIPGNHSSTLNPSYPPVSNLIGGVTL